MNDDGPLVVLRGCIDFEIAALRAWHRNLGNVCFEGLDGDEGGEVERVRLHVRDRMLADFEVTRPVVAMKLVAD